MRKKILILKNMEYLKEIDELKNKVKNLEHEIFDLNISTMVKHDKVIAENNGSVEVWVKGVKIPRVVKVSYNAEHNGCLPSLEMEVR